LIQRAWRFLRFQKDSALAQWYRARTEGPAAASIRPPARRGRGDRQMRRGAANNPSGWLTALLERKAPKLAAVALANKMARIARKPMASATQASAGLSQPPDEIGARGPCLNPLAPTLQETERDGRDRSIGNGG
jgi:hypothetical protein